MCCAPPFAIDVAHVSTNNLLTLPCAISPPTILYQEDGTTATAGHTPFNLKHSTNLAPPEENGSPGSATPPADTGGDPCPSCSSPNAPPLSLSGTAAVDPVLPCRCGDKAQGGRTGGEPVAAADAVGAESVGGGGGVVSSGGIGRGYVGQQAMVATDVSGGGGGVGEAQAATVVGMATTVTAPLVPLQQYIDPRLAASAVAPNQQQPAVGGAAAMMVVDVRNSTAFHRGRGAATPSGEIGPACGDGGGGSGQPWSVFSQQQPALVTPRETVPPMVSDLSGAGVVAMQQQQQQQQPQQDVGALQVDTMDRLAQSLAQAQQLALSVEARQTELLGRPKRRSHPSAKQVCPSGSLVWQLGMEMRFHVFVHPSRK